nr:dynein assembly factor with WDR repeat domains 1 [Ipomoea trifida]
MLVVSVAATSKLKQIPNGIQQLAFFCHFFLTKKHAYGEVHDQPRKPLPHIHYHRPRNWILVVRPVIKDARNLGRVASSLSFAVKHSLAIFESLTTTSGCEPSLIRKIGPYLSAMDAKMREGNSMALGT